jgi:hypothetical protein
MKTILKVVGFFLICVPSFYVMTQNMEHRWLINVGLWTGSVAALYWAYFDMKKLNNRIESLAMIASDNFERASIAVEALDLIRDPRLRHPEPDKYTELGCVMNIADEAFKKITATYSENTHELS